jgi:hypothetical protein
MNSKIFNHALFFLLLLTIDASTSSKISAQTTSNSSSLSNTAAPSASSVTTGGTNINYQTNNAYNNEVGFGPGVFCRTPTLYLGGNGGKAWLNAFDPVQESGNHAKNLAFNMGILYPFGSSALADCKSLVKTIARDREISSQLSMIKACHDLYKKDITVNPELYPLLSSCKQYAEYKKSQVVTKKTPKDDKKPTSSLKLQPKTKRVL